MYQHPHQLDYLILFQFRFSRSINPDLLPALLHLLSHSRPGTRSALTSLDF